MISELNAGQGNVNVEGTIKEKAETRSMNKYGKELRVANAILEDSSGSIKLTLWNDDTARFKEGDRIKIQNGYVGEFQGEKQLTSGKFGSIEKLDSASSDSEKPAKAKKEVGDIKKSDPKDEFSEEDFSDEHIEEEVY
jgi:ssDNA-binding replication factor A large subunit